MNVKKPVDYSAMFAALDTLMTADLPQMALYCEIGRLISGRPEKGAAVAAAEHLRAAYPDVSGFSPRNLRRMREFCRTYENTPEILAQAMTIGWTQNVVILEAELTLRERAWYIQAAGQFGWSKLELTGNIRECIHENMALDNTSDPCYSNGSRGDEGAKKKLPGHFCKVCGMRKSNESFSGRGHATHICKACSRLSPARQAEEMTLRRLENLPPRRLSESEMTWLKNRTHDHRPDVKSLACMVYAQRFPRQARNQKKQELSIQTLTLSINGEICDPYGDPVYVNESYHVSRTPPTVVRTQEDGVSQTIAPPSKILAKLLKWTVHTLEIFWWGEDYCGSADVDLEEETSLWSVHVEYSNGEIQDMKSEGDMPDHVLELLSALAELFE